MRYLHGLYYGHRMTTAPSSTTFSVRLDPEDEVRLHQLAARWHTTQSDAVRRLLRAVEQDAALHAVEVASWPKELPQAMRYRVVHDATVPINMGVGAPVPHEFKVNQIVDRNGFAPVHVEHLHARGVLLEPLAD